MGLKTQSSLYGIGLLLLLVGIAMFIILESKVGPIIVIVAGAATLLQALLRDRRHGGAPRA